MNEVARRAQKTLRRKSRIKIWHRALVCSIGLTLLLLCVWTVWVAWLFVDIANVAFGLPPIASILAFAVTATFEKSLRFACFLTYWLLVVICATVLWHWTWGILALMVPLYIYIFLRVCEKINPGK